MPKDILSAYSKRIEQDEAYRRLRDLFGDGDRSVTLNGPPDSQKAWVSLALMQETDEKLCFLVPDELRARTLCSDLRALTDRPVLIFRSREMRLTDAEAVSRDQERQRLAILDKLSDPDLGAVIVSAAAAVQKLPPQKVFKRHCLSLEVGETWDLDRLCEALTASGYERRRQVDAAGQYARRGDIVDIAVASAENMEEAVGYRVSFFDIEIDALKTFDLESQRSLEMIERLRVPPAHEVLGRPQDFTDLGQAIETLIKEASGPKRPDPEARKAAEETHRLLQKDHERLMQGLSFPGLDRWLHRLYPQAESVLDYALQHSYRLMIDEPQRVRKRLDAAQADFGEHVKSMLEKGQVLAESRNIAFEGLQIGQKIDRWPGAVALCQIASIGNGLPGSERLTIHGRASETYRGREQALSEQVKAWQMEHGQMVLFAGSESRAQRLQQMFIEQGITTDVRDDGFLHGFTWPAAGLKVIGSRDIFGSERTTRRKRRSHGLKIDLFSDLVPGEMVVHEAHGVGRYEGLINLESNGVKRDYLHIQYHGGDSLYLPMESLDQIQKYVGTDGRQPRLSKLGGQEWNRLKEKAKESIRQLATDLVKLYAQRMAVKGHRFAADTIWQKEFEESFPYEETADQVQAIQEIKEDMESDKVMDRLLCGDVGFGKTEVAFRAMFKSVMDGKQAVFLAPTTVLAQQHYENFKERVADFPVRVGLLSRFAPERIQKETLRGLNQGIIDVLIGTHRILSKDVKIKNMGLLVIDEEQRFGVDHKEIIKTLKPGVDVLTLTATPIPRTLHMAMSGIRDISVLEEPPHDRRPVQTSVMEYDEDIVSEALLREITRQGQVFYLYNDTRRIAEKARALEKMLPGARIIYAHGQMNARRLEDVVNDFILQKADILVCTTIIESGIDMPNVNTIVVENADRFGLAQLYQLRGRVGRSDRQAFAYITYRPDKILSEVAEKRLAAIRDFTELGSGFKIALRDLEVRGAGNLLGAEQHGHLEAIGYDLYCRMLENTIQEIKGETTPERVASTVELKVDAYLPKHYIPDEGQRMDMYRKVAAIESFAGYQDVLDEWLDRYGQPPAEALTLAKVAFIRQAAEKNGFSRVEQEQRDVKLSYAEKAQPDMARLSKVLGHEKFKGKLLFNAGSRPYLVYRQAAARRGLLTDHLLELLRCLD